MAVSRPLNFHCDPPQSAERGFHQPLRERRKAGNVVAVFKIASLPVRGLRDASNGLSGHPGSWVGVGKHCLTQPYIRRYIIEIPRADRRDSGQAKVGVYTGHPKTPRPNPVARQASYSKTGVPHQLIYTHREPADAFKPTHIQMLGALPAARPWYHVLFIEGSPRLTVRLGCSHCLRGAQVSQLHSV